MSGFIMQVNYSHNKIGIKELMLVVEKLVRNAQRKELIKIPVTKERKTIGSKQYKCKIKVCRNVTMKEWC